MIIITGAKSLRKQPHFHAYVQKRLRNNKIGLKTPVELSVNYCRNADYVLHLAGINLPADNSEYMP